MAGAGRSRCRPRPSGRPRDVLAYVSWWEFMLWREAHRADPGVQWQRDLSFDECAAAAGIEAPRLAPGEVPMCSDLAVALYWPGRVPGERV